MTSSLLVGNLKDRQLPQILYQLHSSRAVGTLMLTLNEIRKAILFDNGNIISAYSNAREDSLGEVLLRSGSITVEEYLDTQVQVRQGKRFGQILLESSKITEIELSQQMCYQVLGIIYSLFRWQTGLFEFADGKLPPKDLPNLGISTLDIILQGVKLIRSWENIRKEIDSLDEELERVEDWENRLSQIKLNRNELEVFNIIEPGVTLRDICLISKLNSFETCRLITGFLVIELVQKRGMPSWVIFDSFSDETAT
ncbi:MAG: DUF4388 domain-containing protein [Acidobacteria bacterium]|nr:DUF4388 domain-containing protein [Acidobacteriota bacterium]